MITQEELASYIPYPAKDAHKYSRGKCVLLAGSASYPGAACLAARASQYAGAGYTQVFTAFENKLLLRLYRPSLVVNSFQDFFPLQALKPGSTGAFVVGPGFESNDLQLLSLVESVLNYAARPVLIDGGALSYLPALREDSTWQNTLTILSGTLVLTPHFGEAVKLGQPFNIDVSSMSQEEAAHQLSVYYNAIVVFKGPDTVVAYNDCCETITCGNEVLSKAGTGDVLSGIIGGLLAQGMDPFEACVLGASIHGKAGYIAQERYGLVSTCAEEVLDSIPDAFIALGVLSSHDDISSSDKDVQTLLSESN